MPSNSRKRKASELDATSDHNGNPSPRQKKQPTNIANTAPAPEHGYIVEVDPKSDDEDRAGMVLWDEIDWNIDIAVHPSDWYGIKSYRNFIRGSLSIVSQHVTFD